MLKLYSMQDSGNSYKPRLLLAHLQRDYEIIPVVSNDGTVDSDEYRALNPNGKAPLLLQDDGRPVAESNAILMHLAEGSQFIPSDAYERALMYQWLFFEQYSHEPAIAVRRSAFVYEHRKAAATPEMLADTLKRGHHVLSVMEEQLAKAPFMTGEHFTIADIALYGYTHVAHEGGFEMGRFPNIQSWLERVSALPNHVEMMA